MSNPDVCLIRAVSQSDNMRLKNGALPIKTNMNLGRKNNTSQKNNQNTHSDRHFFRFLEFPLQNLLPPFFVFHGSYGASPPFRNSFAPRYDDGEATDQSSNLNQLGPQKLRIKMGPKTMQFLRKFQQSNRPLEHTPDPQPLVYEGNPFILVFSGT